MNIIKRLRCVIKGHNHRVLAAYKEGVPSHVKLICIHCGKAVGSSTGWFRIPHRHMHLDLSEEHE